MATGNDREDRIGDVSPDMLLEWAASLEVERAKLSMSAAAMKQQKKSKATIDGFSKFKRALTLLEDLNGNIAKGISKAKPDEKAKRA